MKREPSFYRRRLNRIRDLASQRSLVGTKIKLQKVEILTAILARDNIDLRPNHFSSGSTVTQPGLLEACKVVCPAKIEGRMTKRRCLEKMLEEVGDSLKKGDYNPNGGTVSRDSLSRVYQGMIIRRRDEGSLP